jgi:hypothetical protein
MGEEAKVKFSESGSQQVVAGFKNVGQAAGGAATNVGQAGNAMKNVGSGMKNTLGTIGQVAGAFATLSLSIVSTWRSYRDLADTQIAVNTSNIKLTNSIQKLNDLKAKQKTLSDQSKKGSVDERVQTFAIKDAQEKLAKAIKAKTITQTGANLAQAKINKMIADSKGPNAEYLKGQREIADQEEIVANNKLKLGEAIERQNDAQQNFYLSLLPTALSSIGTIATVTSAAKMAIGTGTGGLVGSLGGLGLILGGLSLGVLAYQNNWLGFRDVVGGVIDWVKDRLDLWKQGFADVFSFIKAGDWQGAFNRIKIGAQKFWEDLKKTVPFFGGVATIIDQIMHGNWLGAFTTIKVAATKWWADMKIAVPFLADIEKVITLIKEGKWGEAFTAVGDAIKKGLESILGKDVGEKVILKFQLMKDTAMTSLNSFATEMNKKGGPVDLIQGGLAKLGKGDIVGGFTGIWTGLDKAIGIAITHINEWVQLNFGINLKALEQQAQAIGNTILTKIKEGLTFVARTWVDPIITALLNPDTWVSAFIALGGGFVAIGTAFWKSMVSSITASYIADPENSGKIAGGMWEGIVNWFTTNLPDATKAMQGIAQSFTDAIDSSSIWIQNIGRSLWNAIIEGLKAANPLAGGLGGILDKLKLPLLTAEVKPVLDNKEWTAAKDSWMKQTKPVAVPTTIDNTGMKNKLNTEANKITRGQYAVPKLPIDADTKLAEAKRKAIQASINNTKATIKVSIQQQNITDRFSKMAKLTAQGGLHQTLSRDTVIQAHKGEEVHIDKPAKSAGIGNTGKSVNVRVYIGNEEFKGYIHTTVNEDQGNSK